MGFSGTPWTITWFGAVIVPVRGLSIALKLTGGVSSWLQRETERDGDDEMTFHWVLRLYYVRYSAGHSYRALRSLILCVLSSSPKPYAVPTYLSWRSCTTTAHPFYPSSLYKCLPLLCDTLAARLYVDILQQAPVIECVIGRSTVLNAWCLRVGLSR